MARNTGRGSRIGIAEERKGQFLNAKTHGGAFGRRQTRWQRFLHSAGVKP